MTDYSTGIGSLGNDIANDLSLINNDFTILKAIWDGDHKTLTGNGTASTTHQKVTLPAMTVPPTPTAAGILYTKAVGTATELFYLDPAAKEAQITSGGGAFGAADVFCVFDGSEYEGVAPNQTIKVAAIKNSNNVATIGYVAAGKYKINFTNNLSEPDYFVVVQASAQALGYITHIHTLSRAIDSFSFTLRQNTLSGSSASNYSSKDINVAILRNG